MDFYVFDLGPVFPSCIASTKVSALTCGVVRWAGAPIMYACEPAILCTAILCGGVGREVGMLSLVESCDESRESPTDDGRQTAA